MMNLSLHSWIIDWIQDIHIIVTISWKTCTSIVPLNWLNTSFRYGNLDVCHMPRALSCAFRRHMTKRTLVVCLLSAHGKENSCRVPNDTIKISLMANTGFFMCHKAGTRQTTYLSCVREPTHDKQAHVSRMPDGAAHRWWPLHVCNVLG